MPIYDVEIPGKGSFEVESPTELSDEQAYAAVLKQLNAPKPERSWGEALVTDPLASLASGLGGVAQLPGQIGQLAGLVKPEETTTGLMGAGKDLQAWAEKQKSEALRQKQAALQADVAKQEGFFNEASAAIKGTLSDPALLSSFLLEQVPNMIGGLGGGMITRGAVKTLLADATETALQKAAVRGAVGTNAAMQGADVGSGTYEQTYENLIAKGVDPTKANEQALTAAREAALGAATASLGAQFLIPGGQTLEKAFLGRKLPGAGGLVRGLVGEGGSEAFEEGAGQFLSNLAQSQYVPETDLMKGVGQAAGLGGVLGGIMGGASGLTLRGQPAVAPEAVPTSAAPEEAAPTPTPALEDRAFKPVVFPDGSVAYTPEQVQEYEQQQFEKQFSPEVQFAKQLEEQRAAEETRQQEQRAAEETRQQELAQIQQERQATADEIRAADAEQTALNEAVYGKTLTAKEQKMLDNQNRQFEQRRLAAEKEAAKLAQQENKAFLKAEQQELPLPVEIPPVPVEGQPDLFASPAQAKLDTAIKDAKAGDEKAQFMLRDMGAVYTPQVQEAGEKIRAELTPYLDKIGLGNVGLQLVDSINNGTADGAYFRNVIQIALDAKAPMSTLRHETIHALNQLNAFSPQEWSYLNNQAKDKWVNEFIPAEKQTQYKDQYVKDNGSEEGFDQYLQEEAIAEAFRSFGDKPKAGIMKRIVNKLKAFFDATGNWFRGNGFNSVDSIFSGVEAGRYAPKAAAPQIAAQPAYDLRGKFTDAFKKWFGKSMVVDDNGEPLVMYHGTSKDFSIFNHAESARLRGFVSMDNVGSWFTDNPEKAQMYAGGEGKNIMPVYLKIEKPKVYDSFQDFLKDIAVAAGIEVPKTAPGKMDPRPLRQKLKKQGYDGIAFTPTDNQENLDKLNTLNNQLKTAPNELVARRIEREIAATKYELDKYGGASTEFDNQVVWVSFDPNQIKSVFNKAPTAESKDIRYSLRNAPPKRTTKLSEAETAGKAAMAGAQEAWDHLANQDKRTSLRMKLVDVAAPLADRLAKAGLPVYDDTGRLRADMLNHAKNQAINLIKNMMISGQPMVNTDGTLGIERSDKTLARSQQIADSLDNNQFVKDSGLSGRAFVAEVARALRGKDILADDVRRNAKGRRQLEEAKARYKEAKAAAAAGKHRMYKELMRQVAELRRDGYKNKNLKREKMVDQANIDWAEKQLKNVPEVGQILDIWRVNNHALVNLWEQVGLLTAEQADEYRSNVHYVPLFKSAEDLNEDRAFPRAGIGGKSTPKMHKLEGGVHEVNVWENIDKQFARMVALAYENQTRSFAGEQLVGVGGAYETNRSDPNVNLRFKRNGRDVHLVAENPNDVAAFQSMGFQLSPIMKAMAAGTKVLRYGALINPMFWLRQLIRDPIHATMVTNTMVTPFHSTAEFAKILFRKESDAYRTLVERGVIGEVGSTMSIDEFIRTVGTEADKKPGKLHNVLHRLMQIHESSDAATRVAIYESALKKAKAQGMSDARAKDYAVYTAREAINFSVQGNNPMLANLRAMIPFLSASITSLDTVYKAATGYGLNKEEKRQVQQLFMRRAAIFTAMTFAYAMMYQDDDDYKNVPDYIRDNNWLLPMASPSEPGKKVFIKIPLPFEIGFLLKTIPEASIRYMAGTSTGKEVLASYLSGLSHNLPSNGILIPQLAKPILENVTNHSFYTGKPIESLGEQRLPVGMRGTGSSEFAKQLGGAIGYSPKMIDNLINGYFAEAGSSVAGIASYMIHAATGTAPPSKNFEEIWGIKSFVTSPNTSKAIADFYQIDGQAQQTVNEFNELKKTGDYKAIEEFVQDPDKMKQVAAQKSLDRIADAMGKLRAQIRLIERNQTMSPEERRKLINQLQQQQSVLAQTGVSIAEQIGVR